MQQYEKKFKQRVVHIHLEYGRTTRSLADEYGIYHGSIKFISIRNQKNILE